MKNFKSLLLAVVVATGALFTSCTTDTTDSTVTITLETGSRVAPAIINGSIDAVAELKSVTLLLGTSTAPGAWPITSFSALPILKTTAGKYTVKIENLAAGSYTLRAVDKNDKESSATFTVTAPIVAPVLTALASNVTMFCSLDDGSNNTTCASIDGTTYAIKSAIASEQAKVDFVYFYKGMYSPSAYALKTFTKTTSSWSTKNATTFAKSTSIVYADATYDVVKTAADAATATSVLDLLANDVVVFKTAAGKVGVFKVVSITPGYAGTDNIVISVKVQN